MNWKAAFWVNKIVLQQSIRTVYSSDIFWENKGVLLHTMARKTKSLKGLGHAILGNFRTDQIVIESSKLQYKNNGSKLWKNSSKTQERQEETWMDKTGEDWSGLHLDKFEKRRPTFFQIYGTSVYTYIKLLLTKLENHSQLLCGHDFANERLLVRQFDVQGSQWAKLNKIT